jgi:hypothetical protein
MRPRRALTGAPEASGACPGVGEMRVQGGLGRAPSGFRASSVGWPAYAPGGSGSRFDRSPGTARAPRDHVWPAKARQPFSGPGLGGTRAFARVSPHGTQPSCPAGPSGHTWQSRPRGQHSDVPRVRRRGRTAAAAGCGGSSEWRTEGRRHRRSRAGRRRSGRGCLAGARLTRLSERRVQAPTAPAGRTWPHGCARARPGPTGDAARGDKTARPRRRRDGRFSRRMRACTVGRAVTVLVVGRRPRAGTRVRQACADDGRHPSACVHAYVCAHGARSTGAHVRRCARCHTTPPGRSPKGFGRGISPRSVPRAAARACG